MKNIEVLRRLVFFNYVFFLVSALDKVEQSINFKINACTTEEIVDKVTQVHILFREPVEQNKPN